MKKEPQIIINGRDIGPGCSMTIRVAIECFASDLIENGIGDDDHGKKMTKTYLDKIHEIREAIGLI